MEPFHQINFRNILQRADVIASLIIGLCIDMNEYTKDGSGFIKNEQIGKQIIE